MEYEESTGTLHWKKFFRIRAIGIKKLGRNWNELILLVVGSDQNLGFDNLGLDSKNIGNESIYKILPDVVF